MEIVVKADLTKREIPLTPYEIKRNQIEKEEDAVRATIIQENQIQFKKYQEETQIQLKKSQEKKPFISYYFPGMLTGAYLIGGVYLLGNPYVAFIFILTSPLVPVLEFLAIPITLPLMACYWYKKRSSFE
jgi:hypothetical protein